MSSNFHEQLERPEVPLPSDRSTGFVFTAVALAVAYFWRAHPTVPYAALGLAAVLFAISLIVPILLRPLNIAWMWFGLLLGKITNPIIMLLLFAIAIVPAGLLLQMRRDPMRRQRRAGDKSYWIEPNKAERSSMTNQF